MYLNYHEVFNQKYHQFKHKSSINQILLSKNLNEILSIKLKTEIK